MKYLFLLLFTVNSCLAGIAQTVTPSVIITSGTLTKGEDASLSWTIGESLVESYGEEDLLLLQGFNETEDYITAITDDSFGEAGIMVYPTKTSDFVNVIFTEAPENDYRGEFIDMGGKVVLSVVLDAITNEINVKEFSYGMYLLRIISEDQLVIEAKIVKDKSDKQ